MAENTIHWDKDADGIVTLTLDDPTGSANMMNEHYQQSMLKAVERLVAEADSITGVVIASAKKTFFAGGDLKGMITLGPENAGEAFDMVEAVKSDLRKLEKLEKPVVAAINGAALGGGLEIALACHHRIAADVKGSQIGLPEVTLGLLPGGGGVTRTVRMFGIQKAFMEILSQGTRFKPAKAKDTGLVDELVCQRRGTGARRQGVDQGQPRRAHAALGPQGLQDARRYAVAAPAWPASCRRSRRCCEAAQGRADACSASDHGRRGRGCAGRLRHGQPHREPLLHPARHRPGRQEHDPGVLLRPAVASTPAGRGPTGSARRRSPRSACSARA